MATSAVVAAIAGAAGVPLVGDIIGLVGAGGSPRYEGGPLVSTVINRLEALRSGDPTQIAQTHADAVSGGPGWKDAALVLAPAIRPDLFGKPSRTLTADEAGYIAAAGGTVTATPPPGSTTAAPGGAPALTPTLSAISAGMTGKWGWVIGLGFLALVGIVWLVERKKG